MNICKGIIVVLGLMIVTGVHAGSLREDFVNREKTNRMDLGSIQDGYKIPEALSQLTSICTLPATYSNYVTLQVHQTLVQIGLTLNSNTADTYYQAYQQWHIAANSYNNDMYYCVYKMSAYQLQHYFYQVKQGNEVAINPVRSNYTARTEYFNTLKQLNLKYTMPELIQQYLKIGVVNRSDTLKFHPITKRVAVEMTSLYRNIIAETIDGLYQDGILSKTDLAAIGPAIYFNYVEQCVDLRGLTKVVMTTQNKRVVGTSLKSITFNINVCEDRNFLKDFDVHVKDLVYHELAHYLYYIKDTTKADFESLCWSGSTNRCSTKDFVSDYARTAPEEDYAEHFQYWYQNRTSTIPSIVDKFNYFEGRYGSLKSSSR